MGEVDVSLGQIAVASGQDMWQAEIACDLIEINVEAALEEFLRLQAIRTSHWADRTSLCVGRCLGAPVFWCVNTEDGHENEASVMIGHDDETWDVAMIVPLDMVDDLVGQVRSARSVGPG